MNFKFECPHCGGHISATSADVGIEASCPHCANALTIPTVSLEPATAKVATSQRSKWIPIVVAIAIASPLSAAITFAISSRINGSHKSTTTIPTQSVSPRPIPAAPTNGTFTTVKSKDAERSRQNAAMAKEFASFNTVKSKDAERYPGFDPERQRQMIEQDRRLGETWGKTEEEMARMRKEGMHALMFPEDAPGSANYRERQREQSRRASGFYEPSR